MIVYRVSGDADHMSVAFRPSDEVRPLDNLDFDNTRLDPSHVVKVRYTCEDPSPEGVVTDCPYSGVGSALFLSRKAVEALPLPLNEAGFLLRNDTVHDNDYTTFVCYRQIDALDTKTTRFEEWTKSIVHQYQFNVAALEGADIFRLCGQHNKLFVSERFMREVLRRRLTGFRFRRIWSSDTGGVLLKDPIMVFERFPPGYGTTLREKL